MATVYLHIGMPKTGTSHIQNFLWTNDEVLREKGYVYPKFKSFPGIGKARNGYFLRNQLKDPLTGKRDPEKEKEIYNQSFDEISELSQTYDKIILSEEGIWDTPTFSWTKYKKEIDSRDLDTKIIVYLRRQDLFIESYWSQKVKETSVLTFNEYINKKKYSKLRLNYYTRLCEISDVVGKENIIVRVYEKDQYEGKEKNLTSDFLNVIGLKLDDSFIMPERVFNPSLSGIYVEVKRILNYNPTYKIPKSFVVPLLYQTMIDNSDMSDFKSSKYFAKEQQIEFLNQFAQENSLVAKEYLGRENGELFLEKIENNNDESVKYSSKDLVSICGQVIEIQRNNYEEHIAELKDVIKRQQSTINWVTTSFPKKVTRKLKRIFKINRPKTTPETSDVADATDTADAAEATGTQQ